MTDIDYAQDRERWLAQAKRHYEIGSAKWIRVTPQFYDEMLGVLPPAIFTRHGFVMPEPYTHDDEGRAVMMIFRQRRGLILAGKQSTIYEFRYGTLAEAKDILSP